MRSIFGNPIVYHALQSAVGEQKVAPFLERSQLKSGCRLLEIGCGPGIHAHLFSSYDYLGIDISEKYIQHARSRHQLAFEVADATSRKWAANEFDAVFIHSVLHHLSDSQTLSVFDRIVEGLKPDGLVYLTDLVLPNTYSLSQLLARIDRGDFARELTHWRELLETRFRIEWIQELSVGFLKVEFWKMFYAELRPRDTSH
jgi:SAM-dependent methyltransferase